MVDGGTSRGTERKVNIRKVKTRLVLEHIREPRKHRDLDPSTNSSRGRKPIFRVTTYSPARDGLGDDTHWDDWRSERTNPVEDTLRARVSHGVTRGGSPGRTIPGLEVDPVTSSVPSTPKGPDSLGTPFPYLHYPFATTCRRRIN